MFLVMQGRGVFNLPVGGLRVLGRRTLGCAGSEDRVFATFCFPSSSFPYTGPPSELIPHFHQGVGSYCSSSGSTGQGCNRTSILGAWLLQPFICYSEGHRLLAACYQSLSPQPLCPTVSISYGDIPVGPPILTPQGLDGFYRSPGRIPSSLCPSGLSQVSPVLYWPPDIPVSGSLLWLVLRSAGFYACHGPNLLDYAPLWIQNFILSRRLARPRILSPGDGAAESLLSLCKELGVMVNDSKSSLTPTQTIDYLGTRNLVKFNTSKTQLLTISLSNTPSNYPIIFEDSEIPPLNSVNILGLQISFSLSWRDHIVQITKSASKKLGVLFRCKQ